MNKEKTELLAFMDRCPPCLVRVMSVESGKGRKCKPRLKSLSEITDASNLSQRTVDRLSSCPSWDGIKVGVASKFISGCGVDIFHAKTGRNNGKTIKAMTPYYFYRNYIEKDLPHLTQKQKNKLFRLMKWNTG